MDRYYKIQKDSETGRELAAVFEQVKKRKEVEKEFARKYGVERTCFYNIFLTGIDGVTFKGNPDLDLWRKDGNFYVPRKILKNKSKKEAFDILRNDWKSVSTECDRLERRMLDKAIGGIDSFTMAGFQELAEAYIAVVGDVSKYNIPSDCQEISNLDYIKLTE